MKTENNISVDRVTLDSLVFFYFGVTLDEDVDDILDRIVEKAYADATILGAFKLNADPENASRAKDGVNGNTGSKRELINQLHLLMQEKCQDFDNWHKGTCEKLVSIYENCGFKDIFTYGNAQKWINMSLKYIYLLGGISETYESKFICMAKTIRKYSSELHVPIDSFIIDALWEFKEISLPEKEDKKANSKADCQIPRGNVKTWSKWDDGDYCGIQELIREKVTNSPIEWEAYAWIERAKKRRRHYKVDKG